MTATAGNGWSFASARQPARFAAAQHRTAPETEHAFTSGGILCGLPEDQITVYRHLFKPEDSRACPHCRQQVAAAPTRPCGQERLHDRIQDAPPGPLRTRLLAALRSGAEIPAWINGPAHKMAHHTHLDRITEGARPVENLLATSQRIGVARVADPAGEFIVLLPEEDTPVVAFAAQPLSGQQ